MASPYESIIRPKEEEGRILFGVPKKGRLYTKVLEILNGAGLQHTRPERLDVATCHNIDVTLVFLPAADIATYVGEGDVDMGITGIDIIEEKGESENVTILEHLGIGKCKLALMGPVERKFKSAAEVAGSRIVTSFPHLTKKYFDPIDDTSTKPDTSVKYVSGSVEVACTLGLADAVVDLVETGTTMRAAGLEIIDTILQTECVLLANPRSKSQKLIAKLHQRIKGFLWSKKTSMMAYNIEKSKLELARGITPGEQSPTISNLEDPNWVSVTVLVRTNDVADIMDSLQEIGAKSLIVFDVSNCRI
eukprot:m.34270 g.34270  ORF g.34270 m.34270 type:complete len:305 (-) comp8695_c0_seq2:1165-2079(-)